MNKNWVNLKRLSKSLFFAFLDAQLFPGEDDLTPIVMLRPRSISELLSTQRAAA